MTDPEDNEPLISIVTIGRNAAAEMERTAQSVVAQSWRDFEWIVVDGASLDDTLLRLDPFRGAITALISEPDNGIYDAMNKGLRRCRGQYVLFLNAGDWFASSEALAQVVRRLHLGNSPALLFGRVTLLDPEDGYRAPLGEPFSWRGVAFGRLPPHPGCFARRRALLALGGFSTKFGIAADSAAILALVATGGGVDFMTANIAVFPVTGVSSRFDPTFRSLRDRARAVRALAPRWVGVVHTVWWPWTALRICASRVLALLGLLGAWRAVKRTFSS